MKYLKRIISRCPRQTCTSSAQKDYIKKRPLDYKCHKETYEYNGAHLNEKVFWNAKPHYHYSGTAGQKFNPRKAWKV